MSYQIPSLDDRTQHSTIHAILNLIDNISTAIDKSEHTLGIFLDLSKAFDTINHDIILSKLSPLWHSWNIPGVVQELSYK